MRLIGIGISPVLGGSGNTAPALLLSGPRSFPENITIGAALGTLSVINVTGTPSYALTSSAGGMVGISGANLIRGATPWDYETAPFVTPTITVTGTTPALGLVPLTLQCTNVLETILAALGLSPSTVVEGSIAGTVVGAITGKTSGSSLALTDDAGGRFTISGTNLVTTGIPTDYETSTLHAITIRETHPDAAPRDTALAVTVTNIAEGAPLTALTLSTSTVAENATVGAVVGAVLGKTSGSTLLMTGTAGGLFALSGTNVVTAGALDYETATSHSITIRETYDDASNSPRDTVLGITVIDVAGEPGPFTLAWTSADTELSELSFSITPAPLVGDVVTLSLDNNSDMSSPFDTSDANTVDSGEAVAGLLTFTGIATPLAAGLTYARVNVVRGVSSVDSSIVSQTLIAPSSDVTFDAASQATVEGAGTLSWTHTPVGTPSGVVVGMTYWQATLANPTSVKYGGVNMVLDGTVADYSHRTLLYSLASPPAGAQTVAIVWSDPATYPLAGCISVINGDTVDVLRTPVSNFNTGGTNGLTTVTVASAADELVVDIAGVWGAVPTVGADQTVRVTGVVGGSLYGRMSTQPGAASVDMTWTHAATDWRIIAASFNSP